MNQATLVPESLANPIAAAKPALWLSAASGIGTTGARLISGARGERFNGVPVTGHGTSNIAISAWCHPTSTNAAQSPFVFYTGGNGPTYAGACLRLSNVNRYPQLYFATGVDGANVYVQKNTSVPLNTWTHLFGYVDRANKTLYLYVNGVLVNTSAYTGQDSSFNASADLGIGGMPGLPIDYAYDGRVSRAGYFIGTIDHAVAAQHLWNQGNGRFWAEVTQADLIAAGKHYYNLNESSLSAAIDAIGTNDGTIEGTNLLTNPGFETVTGADFTDWTELQTAPGTVTDGTTNARTGSHCACLTSPAGEYVAVRLTNNPAVIGRRYTASWYAKGSGQMQLEEAGTPGEFLVSASYTQKTVTYIPAATSFILKRQSSGTFYIDDVSLTSAQIDSAAGPREATASDIEGGYHGVLTNMDTVGTWSTDTPDGSYTATKADTGKTVNLVGNGDFETLGAGGADVFGSWGEAPTGSSTISADTTEKHSGSRSCKLDFPSGENVYVYQSIGVVGKTYTITFWAKTAEAGMFIYAAHGTASQAITTTTEWAQYSVTLTCASNNLLRIARNSLPGTAWIDDVFVTESAATGTMTGFTDVDAAHVDGPNGAWGPAITDRGSVASDTWLLSNVKDSRSANVPSTLNTRVWDEVYTEPTATGSRSFDAADAQHFNMAAPPEYGTDSFTLEAWVYPTTTTAGKYIIGTGGNAVASPGANIVWSSTGSFVRAYLSDGTIQAYASAAFALSAYTWHHIVAVCDRVAGTLTLYIDGAAVAVQGAIPTGSYTPQSIHRAIGGYYESDVLYTWQGGISRARIAVGYAYSNADIAESYNGGKGRTFSELSTALAGNVRYAWDLAGDGNTNEAGEKGSNTLTQAGTSTDIASGPSPYLPAFDCTLTGYTSSPRSSDVPTALVGKCKSLQGATDKYATTGVKTVTGMGARSVAFWFKRDGNPAANEFIINEGQTSFGAGFRIYMANTGRLLCSIGNGSTTVVSDASLYSNAGFADNAWHHCVMTWDGTTDSNKAILYIDGVQDGNKTTATATSQGGASQYPFQFFGVNGAGVAEFLGLICRPQIFAGRALTADEVATLYAGGDVTEGLTAEWRFNEPDAITVPFEHALKCDGANTIVDTGGSYLGTGAHTVSAWINAATAGEGSAGRIIDSSGFMLIHSANYLGFSRNNFTTQLYSVAGSAFTGSWMHVAVSSDSSGYSNLFVNGRLLGLLRSDTVNAGSPIAGSTSYIANRAALDRTFDGLIGQVRIDSGVLTQAQIRQLALGQSPATPTHSWQFDDPIDLDYIDGCKAIKFDGVDDYIAAANGITAYPFTVMGWMRTSINGTFQGVVSIHSGGSTYWYIGCNSAGYPYISARNTTEYAINGTTVIADGQWHHIAGVFASATDRRLYVDGNLVASDTNSLAFAASADVFLGKVRTSAPSYIANGDIADTRIYSTALTQDQIRSLIRDTDFRTGISAQWKFGETPRSILSCAGGYSLTFDGVDDHLVAADPNESTTALSATGWVKPPVFTTSHYILSHLATPSNFGWAIGYNNTGLLTVLLSTAGNAWSKQYVSSTPMITGTWNHLAFTYASGNPDGTLKLYVNGAQVNVTKTVDVLTPTLYNAAANLTIGAASPAGNFANGRLDDLRVYSATLSDSDIALLAAGGEPTTAPAAHWPMDDGPQYGEPSNGDPIAVWEGRNGINFVQADTLKRPTFLQSGANGRPGITFDGVQQYLASAGWIPNDPYGTLVVALKLNTSQQGAILGSSNQGTGTYEWQAGVYSAGQPWVYQRAADTANAVKNDSYPLGTSAARILTLRSDGSLYDARLDGVSVPLTAYSSTNNGDWNGDSPGRTNLTLGAYYGSAIVNYLSGTVYELLYFPRPLSDVVSSNIERMLATKYGLTLAS
jgi:hypothetical protein